MLILKKQLLTIQAAMVLLLLASCATPTYTYYYSVLKQKDNQVKNNFEKEKNNWYSRYPIQNSVNNTAIDNDAILFFLEISKESAIITVKNKIPIFIDCEKSSLSVNRLKYKFSDWLYESLYNPDKYMDSRIYGKITQWFDKTTHILTINPTLWKKTWWKTNSFLRDIPLDSFLNYNKYDTVDVDEIRNYTVGDTAKEVNYVSYLHLIDMEKKGNGAFYLMGKGNYGIHSVDYKAFTIDIPVIKFTEENTPLKIGIDLIYYTDSTYNDKHEVKTEFYQSELMILKNIRLDVQRKDQNCYYKGEIIGLEVKDISFYTERNTGSVFGLPEMRLGLGKTSYWILSPIFLPIEIVWGIRNAGDGRAVFPYPLFE